MPDAQFADPRLAQLYDVFDNDRSDLAVYLEIIQSFDVKRILDIGCGTGCLACLLSDHGFEVIGIDPAQASLTEAKKKPQAPHIEWIHGTAETARHHCVDLAIMTGNVAQIFLTEDEWLNTLHAIRQSLVDGGYLIFETRKPEAKAWKHWTKKNSFQTATLSSTFSTTSSENIGEVATWCEVSNVQTINQFGGHPCKLVSFNHTYAFAKTGDTLQSHSTICFRPQEAIETSLAAAHFEVIEVRDAPDRTGLEYVFITRAC